MATAPREILARFDLYEESGAPFPPERLPGRRALAGEGGGEAIIRFRVRATGEERWSVVKATPIHDGDGVVQMAINVIEDITAHKRAELRASASSPRAAGCWPPRSTPDEMLEQVATLAVPEVADWCAVDLLRVDGQLEPVALAHADPEMLERGPRAEPALSARARTDAPAGSHVLRTRPSPSSIPRRSPTSCCAARRRTSATLELLGARDALGDDRADERARAHARDDHVRDRPSGRRFDQRDLELAEELARRCAMAVDNARLYGERATSRARCRRACCRRSCPRSPASRWPRASGPPARATRWAATSTTSSRRGGRGWTVVIGDVCGKGPDAAALTALARYTLRAAAMHERLPSRVLHV